ncbi:hypothetical protein, conserved in T. vivax [Trypanosoma vivax Y486]|uniref:Uncharacterized protein n=1 Tax=Trypanosoma vivax (strain Y486) TaxID=1055687 RepID=F9WQ01_TRYVY|nr:hypothetical protein, conserved in T. vivax [Trypanosoma vivax Y486]|eukprot:CCD19628.1 hypothetical protein, conserved in T. vivax [Trypanosoma vivax Y486]
MMPANFASFAVAVRSPPFHAIVGLLPVSVSVQRPANGVCTSALRPALVLVVPFSVNVHTPAVLAPASKTCSQLLLPLPVHVFMLCVAARSASSGVASLTLLMAVSRLFLFESSSRMQPYSFAWLARVADAWSLLELDSMRHHLFTLRSVEAVSKASMVSSIGLCHVSARAATSCASASIVACLSAALANARSAARRLCARVSFPQCQVLAAPPVASRLPVPALCLSDSCRCAPPHCRPPPRVAVALLSPARLALSSSVSPTACTCAPRRRSRPARPSVPPRHLPHAVSPRVLPVPRRQQPSASCAFPCSPFQGAAVRPSTALLPRSVPASPCRRVPTKKSDAALPPAPGDACAPPLRRRACVPACCQAKPHALRHRCRAHRSCLARVSLGRRAATASADAAALAGDVRATPSSTPSLSSRARFGPANAGTLRWARRARGTRQSTRHNTNGQASTAPRESAVRKAGTHRPALSAKRAGTASGGHWRRQEDAAVAPRLVSKCGADRGAVSATAVREPGEHVCHGRTGVANGGAERACGVATARAATAVKRGRRRRCKHRKKVERPAMRHAAAAKAQVLSQKREQENWPSARARERARQAGQAMRRCGTTPDGKRRAGVNRCGMQDYDRQQPKSARNCTQQPAA